jgi:hypothetical protein
MYDLGRKDREGAKGKAKALLDEEIENHPRPHWAEFLHLR